MSPLEKTGGSNYLPPIDLQAQTEVSDSCNCCNSCNVSCCFPFRRAKKHKKTCPESVPEKVNTEATKVFKKKTNK